MPPGTTPPEPPGAAAAWVALVCGLGSLVPAAALVLTGLVGGRMDVDAVWVLMLFAPVLGVAAVIMAMVASVRAKRHGTALPRRRLPTAVCGGLLGIVSFVALLMLLVAAINTTFQ